MKEFSVSPNPNFASPNAPVQFNVTNKGLLPHEFVVMKTDLAPDKLVIDPATNKAIEDDPGVQEDVGEVGGEEPFLQPNQTDSGTFNLEAGKYVLICNIPGHYAAGMHAAFTVGAAPARLPTTGGQPAGTAFPWAGVVIAAGVLLILAGSSGLVFAGRRRLTD